MGSSATPAALRRAGLPCLAWVIVFFAISLLIWVAIWFWGRNLRLAAPLGSVVPASSVSRVVPPRNNAPVMNVEEVAASNDRPSFIGRAVKFDHVTVRKAMSSGFWIGPGEKQLLFVGPAHPLRPHVEKGQTVSVSGLILNVPGVELVEKDWHLDRTEALEVVSEQVYLRASTFEPR